jgi:hypothetical protein
VNFGSRGAFFNTGIPGTGLYSRQRLGSQAPRTSLPRGTVAVSATVRLSDDGTISFLDASGQPLRDDWIRRAKRQQGDQIREMIQTKCDEINAAVESLARLHWKTPAPHERLKFEARTFEEPRPAQPVRKKHGLLGWLFQSVRSRIDQENAYADARYQQELTAWNKAKAAFEDEERQRKELLERGVLSNVEAMETVLEGALQAIQWPEETSVSAEVRQSGELVLLDVDLPEIEDLPTRTANYSGRGFKLSIKEMSTTQKQKLYVEHVHSIGFRIIDEVLAVLPKAHTVILSAYSQRASRATGQVGDEYLYSVRVCRPEWGSIDFASLERVDAVAALERFELRRELSKTGVFKPIEPMMA